MDVNGTTTAHVNWPTTDSRRSRPRSPPPSASGNVTVAPAPEAQRQPDLDRHLRQLPRRRRLRRRRAPQQRQHRRNQRPRGVTGSPGSPAVAPSRTNLMLDSSHGLLAPVGASTWPSWYQSQSKNFPELVAGHARVRRRVRNGGRARGRGGRRGRPADGQQQPERRLLHAGRERRPPARASTGRPPRSAIQTAITTIVGAGNVTVTSGPGGTAANPVWTVTFASSLGDVDFDANDNLNSGSIDADEITTGVTGSPGSPAVDPNYTFAPLSNDFRTSDAPGLNASSTAGQGDHVGVVPRRVDKRDRVRDLYRISRQHLLRRQRGRQHLLHRRARRGPGGACRRAGRPPARRAAGDHLPQRRSGQHRGRQPMHHRDEGRAGRRRRRHMVLLDRLQRLGLVLELRLVLSVPDRHPRATQRLTRRAITAYHTLAQIARTSSGARSTPSKFFCVGTPSQSSEPCQNGARSARCSRASAPR